MQNKTVGRVTITYILFSEIFHISVSQGIYISNAVNYIIIKNITNEQQQNFSIKY